MIALLLTALAKEWKNLVTKTTFMQQATLVYNWTLYAMNFISLYQAALKIIRVHKVGRLSISFSDLADIYSYHSPR